MFGIAIFGCGYVGLVSAACLAHLGHTVICYDTDFTKIHDLQYGSVPFFEPGLEELIAEQTAVGRLCFCTRPDDALEASRIAFIAVGTPTGPTGEADLTFVRQAARDIAAYASRSMIVVSKSIRTASSSVRPMPKPSRSFARFTRPSARRYKLLTCIPLR